MIWFPRLEVILDKSAGECKETLSLVTVSLGEIKRVLGDGIGLNDGNGVLEP